VNLYDRNRLREAAGLPSLSESVSSKMPLKWSKGTRQGRQDFEGNVQGTRFRSVYGGLDQTVDGPKGELYMVIRDAPSGRNKLSFSMNFPEGKPPRTMKRLVQAWVNDLWGQYAEE